MEPGEVWSFEAVLEGDSMKCELRPQVDGEPPTAAPCDVAVTWTDDNGGTRLKVNSREYAHGTLRIAPEIDTVDPADAFHVVLAVDLEKYLYGLGEMPSSWPAEALRAQAIIARGYAIATALARALEDGSVDTSDSVAKTCHCHIRDDSRDQVYSGWSKENETVAGTNYGQTKWVPAVDGTAGMVVTYSGNIISAFYSSSTGGHTENNEDVWGGEPRAWLRSVPDPFAADPNINPLARWTVYVRPADLAAALGWDDVTAVIPVAGPPGSEVKFTGRDGGSSVSVIKSGTEVRAILGTFGFRSDGNPVRTSPYIIAVVPPFHFLDIGDSTHREDIIDIWERGITKGCNPPDNTLFCPDDSVTRGQMAAFLVRALNLPATDQDFFSDDDGSTFENDINRLAAAGVTRGCNPPTNSRYCPGDPVTRGQMAAFLHRAFVELLTPGSPVSFVDDNGSTFEADIEWLGATGVTKGCNPPTNDRYCPTERVTRGQMASFLSRALGMAEG
jgi:hypothetical protein